MIDPLGLALGKAGHREVCTTSYGPWLFSSSSSVSPSSALERSSPAPRSLERAWPSSSPATSSPTTTGSNHPKELASLVVGAVAGTSPAVSQRCLSRPQNGTNSVDPGRGPGPGPARLQAPRRRSADRAEWFFGAGCRRFDPCPPSPYLPTVPPYPAIAGRRGHRRFFGPGTPGTSSGWRFAQSAPAVRRFASPISPARTAKPTNPSITTISIVPCRSGGGSEASASTSGGSGEAEVSVGTLSGICQILLRPPVLRHEPAVVASSSPTTVRFP